MSSDLIVLAHREPYEERQTPEGLQRVLKTNGVFRTLDAVLRQRAGTWVAWRSREGEVWDSRITVPEGPDGSAFTVRRIPLTPAEARGFYYDFTSTALWPVLFSMLDRARFTKESWSIYRRVNRMFADAVCEEAAEGALVWINDFHLMLTPKLLRARRPDLRLALFLHTVFPPPDIFGVIPWREELLDGLLHLDLAGFHIPSYALNFANAAERFMGATPSAITETSMLSDGPAVAVLRYPSALTYHGREIRLEAYPVGVDVERLTALATTEQCRADRTRIAEGTGQGRVVLSAERLDYVKGFIERLECFERYLERHPEQRGRVSFIQIAVPTRTGMEEFQEMRRQVEEAVGRINGRFGRLDWQPVQFFYKSFPIEELVAFYRAADVAWVTPLRDGLNLVAKEYVATRVDGDGVVVLSEFAGAAADMDGAVLTNPYSPDDMDRALDVALTMPEDEQRLRMVQLRRRVRDHNVQWWADGFLRDAESIPSHSPVIPQPA